MQGVGGLEDIYDYGHISATSFVQDCFGNILAFINNGTVTWSPARFGSYGPVPGYQTPALSPNVELEVATGWRGKRLDETGLIYLNARYYDPVAGRFISHDPVFDPDSPDGFAFAGSDAVNGFDPTGRFGVGAWQSGKGLATGFGTLFYNVGGTIGYGVTSVIDAGFGSDLSSTYKDEWDGIKGVGRGVGTLGGQAIHGQFGQIGKELTGGEGRSGAYRTGYAGVAIASLFSGGEVAEAGNVGKVAEVAEVSSQAAMRARVLANIAESQAARSASKFDQFAKAEAAAEEVTTPVGELRSAGLKDAHHVIQDAAVRDLPGYNTQLAPGVQLQGPSTAVGSPHYLATQVQRLAGGGTYAAERAIAAQSLRAGGYSEAQIQQALSEADAYFNSIGVKPSTITRIPGNRP